MENFDISYWVRSLEIAKHLQHIRYGETTREQMQLVLFAHRPLKEKADILWKLWRFAESAEEREPVKAMWELYRFAVKELEDEREGNLFLGKQCLFRPDIEESDDYGDTQIFFSCREMLSYAEKEQWHRAEIEKYRLGGNSPLQTGNFYFERVEGQLCAVGFSLEDTAFPSSLELKKVQKQRWRFCARHRSFPLPFTTGDLVRLDTPPCLEEPVYGVLYSSENRPGDRYVWIGYIRDGRLLDISLYEQSSMGKGYRVIDWLHSADAAMLPAGHEILAELGAYMKGLSQREAEDVFFHVFCNYNGDPLQIYRKIPLALEELLPQKNQ